MTYRDYIIKSINTLIECDTSIFPQALNLLMSNELKDVGDVFENGDTYEFSINHLENSRDTNVQLLLRTIKELRNTVNALQNLNLINDNEIDWT